VATVWGVFGAVGSLGGSLLGLLAGYLIQEAGYESVFLMIASPSSDLGATAADLRAQN